VSDRLAVRQSQQGTVGTCAVVCVPWNDPRAPVSTRRADVAHDARNHDCWHKCLRCLRALQVARARRDPADFFVEVVVNAIRRACYEDGEANSWLKRSWRAAVAAKAIACGRLTTHLRHAVERAGDQHMQGGGSRAAWH
jgi:hypothetical protein